jgi:hypothetical protein
MNRLPSGWRVGGEGLLILTMRHSGRDKLADLWDALSSGWRTSFGNRTWTGQRARTVERGGRLTQLRPIMGDAERFDVAGITRVVEATYGSPAEGGNGWHYISSVSPPRPSAPLTCRSPFWPGASLCA